ncbi:thymidylate kinase [Scytonema hofmannii PCC 7110]|uniref:Thymidylate kinase n=1 Tax=Scytonema hofmannii PCC 7110 TaxID=128403 RepID=A0A139WRS5_9CYAN|nr:dTMP kinase [Scytonema hofmannii]KYC35136.1 thymidylate kinase [Scytonema hofmannii PCC 7110]KYC44255.1 thymidylate kinase [Scytonema hofmannii PCC 7110]
MSGKFLVFEGVEGCGKTSQIQRTQEWLESLNISAIVTREPGGTELGLHLRQLLLEAESTSITNKTELLLYAADRSQHVDQIIKPALAEGKVVLCDRYTDSTIAYQGWGRGISLEMIEQLNLLATGGLQSNLTILLDIDPEISFNRIVAKRQLDRMEQADLAFHHRVRQGFLSLAEKFPERIVAIDANQNIDKVTADIQQLLISRR